VPDMGLHRQNDAPVAYLLEMPSLYSVLAPEMNTGSTDRPIQALGTDALPRKRLSRTPREMSTGEPRTSLGEDQPGASARSSPVSERGPPATPVPSRRGADRRAAP
jgi:hypothetical protein